MKLEIQLGFLGMDNTPELWEGHPKDKNKLKSVIKG